MEEEGTTNTVLCHAQSQKSALAPRAGSDQIVWIDSWQMQCCGDPFRVGSNVSWNLRPADRDWLTSVLGEETSTSVDWAEEHHSDSTSPATEAKVVTITAVHCRYAPIPGDPRALYPVEGSAVLSSLESADGWAPDQDDLTFVGYLVKLEADFTPRL